MRYATRGSECVITDTERELSTGCRDKMCEQARMATGVAVGRFPGSHACEDATVWPYSATGERRRPRGCLVEG